MSTPIRILILEDSAGDAELMVHELRRSGFDPLWQRIDGERDYLASLDPPPDVILADYTLPQFDALQALQLLKEQALEIPFIIVSGTIGETLAVECMKHGAADYVLKDRLGRLGEAVRRVLENRDLRKERRQAKEERDRILNLSPDLICVAGTDGYLKYVNPAWEKTLGYTKEELLSRPFLDFICPEDHRKNDAEVEKLATGQTIVDYEDRYIHRDGTLLTFLWTAVPLPEEGLMFCIGRDITRRKRAEEALMREKERLVAVSENAPFGIVLIDPMGAITYINPKFTEITGYELADIPDGKTWFHKAYPDPAYRHTVIAAWVEDLKNVEAGGKRPRVFSITRKDGATRIISFASVQLRTGEHMMSCDDITEQKQLEDKLQALSIIDDLTGLYNRRGFLTLAEQQIKIAERSKKEMLLVFADLDHMKETNDTLGHLEGDRALAETASILRETFRSSDIIGRIGGDEYAVLVIDASEETQETVMKRLRETLDARNGREGLPYTLSLSTGIAYYHYESPSSFDELMARADALMYQEKRRKEPK